MRSRACQVKCTLLIRLSKDGINAELIENWYFTIQEEAEKIPIKMLDQDQQSQILDYFLRAE